MTTIPLSYSVKSTPSVLNAGGDSLALNGLCVVRNTRVPIGQVLSFGSPEAVATFFGSASAEAVIAGGGETLSGNPAGTGYFGGYENATTIPGALLFAQYPETAVAAYLRGGNAAAALTLAQLQALSGSLTVVMDGYAHVIASINFAASNSFSAAAAAIQAAFTDPTESSFTASIGATATGAGSGTNLTLSSVVGFVSTGDSVTGSGVPANTTIVSQTSGTTGGNGVYVTNNPTTVAGAVVVSSTVLDVTVDTDHTIAIGQTVTGAGVTGSPVITAQLTGVTGQSGTYRISGAPQQVASEAMTGVATAPLVTFDSVSGAFVITSGVTGSHSTAAFATGTLATPLLLTSATGAVLSQGSDAQTPAQFMAGVVNQTTQWASFFLAFDPDNGSGNTQKMAFVAWTNSVSPRYVFINHDGDVTPTLSVPATASQGFLIESLSYQGTCLIYEPVDFNHASFISGAIAAIDFTQVNGRISFAYKTQPGLAAAVSDQQSAINLGGNPFVTGDFGNGYNFVGAFGNAGSAGSVNFQRGTVSGDFVFLDSYVNQIWLTNAFQSAAYAYMLAVRSFPYTPAGNANFETAMQSVVQQGLAFGAYAGGVVLSSTEIAEINSQAGANIAQTLATQGYYFQIKPADPSVRASRGSPPITFWYVDEGSVQALNIGSVAVR